MKNLIKKILIYVVININFFYYKQLIFITNSFLNNKFKILIFFQNKYKLINPLFKK